MVMAVNLSALQFHQKNLQQTSAMPCNAGLDPQFLELKKSPKARS